MILLNSTSDLIQVVTSGTQNTAVHASFLDNLAGAITPLRTNTPIISSATTTTVVASPASSTSRNVKFLSIANTDATNSNTITVNHTDGSNVIQLFKATLPAGWTATYNDLEGWVCIDAGGGRVETPLSGRYLGSTLLTAASANFTTGKQTNSIYIRGVAGGGQGGGNPATLGTTGSGGGSGSYAEWQVAVSPNTAYAYTCGPGGSTAGTNANGQAGSNSTFVVGGTTVTCNGGGGGINGGGLAVAVIGGAGGALSTNGTVNAAGQPGQGSSNGAAGADNISGAGGSSPLGGGANGIAEATNSNGSSAAALGYGGGGGGSATSAGTARAGGAGAPGAWIVDEYS